MYLNFPISNLNVNLIEKSSESIKINIMRKVHMGELFAFTITFVCTLNVSDNKDFCSVQNIK